MCGGFAVMCGLEGQAVVKDGGKAQGWDQEQNGVGDKVFHGFAWCLSVPDRSGWADRSDYVQGVNP
jgi:hypothetical protein